MDHVSEVGGVQVIAKPPFVVSKPSVGSGAVAELLDCGPETICGGNGFPSRLVSPNASVVGSLPQNTRQLSNFPLFGAMADQVNMFWVEPVTLLAIIVSVKIAAVSTGILPILVPFGVPLPSVVRITVLPVDVPVKTY